MEIHLPRIQAGQVLTADHINLPNDAIERSQLIIGPNSGLGYSNGPSGISIWVIDQNVRCWGKITGFGGGAYSWIEQYSVTGGTWTNGIRTGTTTNNQAYEVNGSITVAVGKIVRMTFNEAVQSWSFPFGVCS